MEIIGYKAGHGRRSLWPPRLHHSSRSKEELGLVPYLAINRQGSLQALSCGDFVFSRASRHGG